MRSRTMDVFLSINTNRKARLRLLAARSEAYLERVGDRERRTKMLTGVKRAAVMMDRFFAGRSPFDSMSLPDAVRGAIRSIETHMTGMHQTVVKVKGELDQQKTALEQAVNLAVEMITTPKPQPEQLNAANFEVFEMSPELRQDLREAMRLVKMMKEENLLPERKKNGTALSG